MEISGRKLTYGVGITDIDYAKSPTVDGKRVWCPYHLTWRNMLKRCYCEKYQERRPTYRGCTVCKEWLTFSNFKSWMQEQPWQGNELDKDVLVLGNKLYSPETCRFIPRSLNTLLTDTRKNRRKYAIGVHVARDAAGHARGKFLAAININGKKTHLGSFSAEKGAAAAYILRKCLLIEAECEKQTDGAVIVALQNRVTNMRLKL